ncbi:DUF3037 domain-containing protein [Rubrolithibacter danxiaensis]|uniref:DUF3037 domain-containing protein n=1 Tax=Rubrolithibacter danxiaensis TaxID=3390805 RepID=UPI003BF78E94
MQENHLFEYAVIRVVPRVEREEFLNIGVILYCLKQKFLQIRFNLDDKRLQLFSESLDIKELEEHLLSFSRICEGSREGGPIAKLDPASRFRWLTATRSTVVQTSKVHPGFCKDATETLNRLYNQLVL